MGLLLLSALPPCLWRRNLFGLLTGYGAESATVSVQTVAGCFFTSINAVSVFRSKPKRHQGSCPVSRAAPHMRRLHNQAHPLAQQVSTAGLQQTSTWCLQHGVLKLHYYPCHVDRRSCDADACSATGWCICRHEGGRKKRGHRQVSAGCIPSSPTVPLNCHSRANSRACMDCT